MTAAIRFFGPNSKARKDAGAENLSQGHIGRVSALRHQNAPEPDAIVTRIESAPASPKIDLHPSREIHWRVRGRNPNIAHIAGAVSRGDVEAPAECDRQVGEIAANAAPLGVGLRCCAGRTGMFVSE